MGLGLRSLVLCSLTQMAEEIHGFVEFIDEAEEARTLSTISTAVMSIVDLTDLPVDDLRPALTALADCYDEEESVCVDNLVPADFDLGEEEEVEFIGTVNKPSSSSVGDAVINALDTFISQQSAVVFSNSEPL